MLGGRTVRGSAAEVASRARRGSIEMLGGRTVRGSATEIARTRGATLRRLVVRELGTGTARPT
jgi:hypothetical protein